MIFSVRVYGKIKKIIKSILRLTISYFLIYRTPRILKFELIYSNVIILTSNICVKNDLKKNKSEEVFSSTEESLVTLSQSIYYCPLLYIYISQVSVFQHSFLPGRYTTINLLRINCIEKNLSKYLID